MQAENVCLRRESPTAPLSISFRVGLDFSQGILSVITISKEAFKALSGTLQFGKVLCDVWL
jgi:hypothetical protein